MLICLNGYCLFRLTDLFVIFQSKDTVIPAIIKSCKQKSVFIRNGRETSFCIIAVITPCDIVFGLCCLYSLLSVSILSADGLLYEISCPVIEFYVYIQLLEAIHPLMLPCTYYYNMDT